MLTTITPVWGRTEALTVWLRSISTNPTPGVKHLLMCVGDHPDYIWTYHSDNLLIYPVADKEPRSIGYYHNMGARLVESDWIMKLDVDCIPHTRYFTELLPILNESQPRQWFNGGMYYVDRVGSSRMLNPDRMPLLVSDYDRLTDHHVKLPFPAGTNFICRRKDYLDLGGCDERFEGYGWEDYQQIYMLEKHQIGECPLSGRVDEGNVTQRCRDEISRRKAKELSDLNERLVLLHRWHEAPPHGVYKNVAQTARNRRVLLEYITKARSEHGLCE